MNAGKVLEGRVSVDEASIWASGYTRKRVTKSNISYLIQYGRITRYLDESNRVAVSLEELKAYYDATLGSKEDRWKSKLGDDTNWFLSFDDVKEKESTKHVHRLHPYKGKYIPQLVEYFLDGHVDEFKRRAFFKPGDVVIDPFCGSGTTLVQSGELGIHAIGLDISSFNCMIVRAKIAHYDLALLGSRVAAVVGQVNAMIRNDATQSTLARLRERVHEFNKAHFSDPSIRRKIASKEVDEDSYGADGIAAFLRENASIIEQLPHRSKTSGVGVADQGAGKPSFLDTWFNPAIIAELRGFAAIIGREGDPLVRNLLTITLTRAARACRSTKHFDLATLKEPQLLPYYCYKHKKICLPVESSAGRFKRYLVDAVSRIKAYSALRKDVELEVVHCDSRDVDLPSAIAAQNPRLHGIFEKRMADGVFCSPPYVGTIDYHEQHAYAYELFGLHRRDEAEIGAFSKGTTVKAKEAYVDEMAAAFKNVCRCVKPDGDVFIVANDKFHVYPEIARKAKLDIVEQFKRPVLNRAERDRQPYAEIIFHMKVRGRGARTLLDFV
ncbi:MAG: site-specific DNA-methyltransferase [Candidatus Lokiarchaeota archaeon]|nr:site-specific DNA-methyltransferase [Candidatus Lokiarchaeota archaeon]